MTTEERATIDALFGQIGTSSLTDQEWTDLQENLDAVGVNVESYEALLAVLDSRESISEARNRLRYYYLARGVDVGTEEESAAASNIYIGDAL
jgi:hypothetical protein